MSEGRNNRGEQRSPQTGTENASIPPQRSDDDAKPRTTSQTDPGKPIVSTNLDGTVRLSLPPSQVARTVAGALLTAAVVLGGSFCSGRYALSSAGSSLLSSWRQR